MTRFICNMALLAWLLVSLTGCQSISKNESYIGYSTFTETDGWQIWKLNLKTKQTQQLIWSKNEAYYPTFGPTGELAYNDHNGRIWFVKSNVGKKTQKAELLEKLPKYCGHPAISPDGLSLACVCFNFINRSEDSDLYLVSLQKGKSKRLKTLPGIQKHPSWSPDGQ